MFKKDSSIDVIDKILDACYRHNPDALFIMSLMHQYEERGSLSKKQLQGLYLKAQNVKDMPANWLATLEAVIAKMPNRFKSEKAESTPLYQKDEEAGNIISAILNKYPQHKRVLYLQAKYNNNDPLTAAEIAELEKFKKLLL
ncbi:hypothetical protein FC093_13355 [Ilyomonas limi]|uniref:Uncharacterized protein n=1 Tax=Ilyomonas limi TaxID=2575867 RepID=A0A4U3KYD3_9BACT|nr:hypothetical protein [Ilyomonas limi]TKK67731.1 hypothetical protein FC093_13355 [Ilyomonas limi]